MKIELTYICPNTGHKITVDPNIKVSIDSYINSDSGTIIANANAIISECLSCGKIHTYELASNHKNWRR
jgi:hypothetical protein